MSTAPNSWILHLAVRFRPRAVVNTPIPQVAGGAKDIPPRVAADVIRTRTIVVLLQPLYKPSGSEYGLRFRSYHSLFPSDTSITHETILGTPKATVFQRARSAYTSAMECCPDSRKKKTPSVSNGRRGKKQVGRFRKWFAGKKKAEE